MRVALELRALGEVSVDLVENGLGAGRDEVLPRGMGVRMGVRVEVTLVGGCLSRAHMIRFRVVER